MQFQMLSGRCAWVAALAVSAWASRAMGQAAAVPGTWQQSWSDQFNTGSSDLSGWHYETGNNGGWGNNESETYTSSSQNAYVANGDLNITGIVSTTNGKTSYTSARITTTNLFTQKYGLIQFSAAMPAAMASANSGLWPAVWMMPENSVYGGWPTSGEIDILESKQSNAVQGSLHTGPDSADQQTQTKSYSPSGFDATQFHTYDLEWNGPTASDPNGSIEWFVDGHLYEDQTSGWYVPPGASDPEAPFDQPFYLIINMALGGDYVNDVLPANGTYDMKLDYIEAFTDPVPEPLFAAPVLLGLLLLVRRRKPAPALVLARR